MKTLFINDDDKQIIVNAEHIESLWIEKEKDYYYIYADTLECSINTIGDKICTQKIELVRVKNNNTDDDYKFVRYILEELNYALYDRDIDSIIFEQKSIFKMRRGTKVKI